MGSDRRGRMRSFGAVLMIVIGADAASACSHGPSTSAPNSSLPASVVVPSPAPGDVTLTGRVTEAPPTSSTGIWDAVVTLEDGVGGWQSARTIGGVGRGVYTISGLHAGRFRATVSADGFVGVTREVTVGSDNTIDFQLLPVAVSKSVTVSNQLNDGGGTCSDGAQARPCHIVALPVHNRGSIDATLTWPVTGPVLALVLFETGSPVPMAASTSSVNGNAHLAMDLDGGVVYEIRVIYASGTGTATYSLSVAYPN
jgi:Carboxypeptidase regulatory-like domain